METFSFSPQKNFAEEGKWLLAVTSFEANISVFNRTDENNSFHLAYPDRWSFLNCLVDGINKKL